MKKYEAPIIEIISFDNEINTAADLSSPNINVPWGDDWNNI